jgi:hypothetical protein
MSIDASSQQTSVPIAPRPERRAAVRFPANLDGSCECLVGPRGECWMATIQDISSTGMSLGVERRFEPGTLVLVDMPPTTQCLVRSLLARVKHVRQADDGSWILGCAFLKPLSNAEVQDLL